ncbi:MAG: hypothetical protein LC791_14805 [Acidobacteria bacterium]|nr:hypothetical protein [Acidobacteriota bacterium]
MNALGPLDHLQIVATGLEPGREYEVSIVTSRTAPFGTRTPLAKGKANPAGALLAQALGPLRAVAGPDHDAKTPEGSRFLLVTASDGNRPILIQKAP